MAVRAEVAVSFSRPSGRDPLLDFILDACHTCVAIRKFAKVRGIDGREPCRRLVDMVLADYSAAKGGPDLKGPPLAHAASHRTPLARWLMENN
jgi:hypothetical protein